MILGGFYIILLLKKLSINKNQDKSLWISFITSEYPYLFFNAATIWINSKFNSYSISLKFKAPSLISSYFPSLY